MNLPICDVETNYNVDHIYVYDGNGLVLINQHLRCY